MPLHPPNSRDANAGERFASLLTLAEATAKVTVQLRESRARMAEAAYVADLRAFDYGIAPSRRSSAAYLNNGFSASGVAALAVFIAAQDEQRPRYLNWLQRRVLHETYFTDITLMFTPLSDEAHFSGGEAALAHAMAMFRPQNSRLENLHPQGGRHMLQTTRHWLHPGFEEDHVHYDVMLTGGPHLGDPSCLFQTVHISNYNPYINADSVSVPVVCGILFVIDLLQGMRESIGFRNPHVDGIFDYTLSLHALAICAAAHSSEMRLTNRLIKEDLGHFDHERYWPTLRGFVTLPFDRWADIAARQVFDGEHHREGEPDAPRDERRFRREVLASLLTIKAWVELVIPVRVPTPPQEEDDQSHRPPPPTFRQRCIYEDNNLGNNRP